MKTEIPFFRTPFNYDRNAASDDSGLRCDDPTRTQQHFREECDINTIVERFGLTGELPSDLRVPQYGDFTNVFDYHSAMNAVAAANESFDLLPASIRARFENDPAQFVDFCTDPANKDELIKMGLAVASAATKAESSSSNLDSSKSIADENQPNG